MISPEESQSLEKLIREVGAILKEYWPGDPSSQKGKQLTIYDKSDGSKVTEADFAANEVLVAGLRKLFPKDAIVSEEGPKDDGHQTMSRVWIVDPLDGTHSFIAGKDDFSVLVGLSVGTQIKWGGLYFPVKEVFAIASAGNGALLNGTTRGKVSDRTQIKEQGIYYRNCELNGGSLLYPNWMDSGMAFLALCRGEFDGVIIRMKTHQEWDLAAPAVMVTESGGIMTDERGDPIRFNQGKIDYKYLVASNGKVHRQLLELIRESNV